MTQKSYNVLFICTWNSARSIMAEAILNQMGNGYFRAFSAGSHPIGEVNPLSIHLLQSLNYDTVGLRSKHWDEFISDGAPHFDFVFTVCDKTAGEPCPDWPGQPMPAQWGVEDPVRFFRSVEQQQKAFFITYLLLKRRISLFCSLPIDKLDAITIKRHIDDIGLVHETGV
ncbi:MAG: arsenate reductase ArsC [Methylobacter tundripaludum]|nr:arsenate reductase ArsC [Methylobacter tundripaludum]MCK9636559.1 arsenate reductase ArsC [Methylobacter tundripaludum]